MKRLMLAALTVVALSVVAQTTPVHAQAAKPASKAMTAKGTVKSTSGTSLVIVSAGKDMTFTMDGTTTLVGKGIGTKAKGGTIPANESLAAGDSVSVTYTGTGGTMHASTVRVTAKAAPAKK